MKKQVEIREDYYQHLVRNFIGPMEGDEEVLTSKTPHDIYLTGALYPPSLKRGHDPTDSDEDYVADTPEGHQNSAEEETATSKDVPEEKVLFPSSAGLTFRTGKHVALVTLNVSFGLYKQITVDGKPALQRFPISHSATVDLARSQDPIKVEWAEIEVKVRPQKDSKLITVTLVNRARMENFIPKGRNSRLFRNLGTLWQCKISVTEMKKGEIIKVEPEPRITSSPEANAGFLLYRSKMPFASGHNCSCDWGKTDDGRTWVETDFMPRFPLKMMMAPSLDGVDLNIKNFCTPADLQRSGIKSLQELSKQYGDWILQQKKEAAGLSDGRLKSIADKMIKSCEEAHKRLVGGLKLLSDNPKTAECFCIANVAMKDQFEVKNTQGRNFIWRPFQIAFFLLNLSGLVNPKSPERKIADLLWFPTGGGKTEAYLLISAFTIAWRRANTPAGISTAGVTIILRYTLRLLTQQQLQRSARLICSLEKLRRTTFSGELGDSEISIGLWVGRDSFPNTAEEWEAKKGKGTVPVPFENCPSCDAELKIQNYNIRRTKVSGLSYKILELTCDRNAKCFFHRKPLPIHLIDDDVYRQSPTLIVGTVDKFANFAWKPEPGKLLNRYQFRCNQHGTYFDTEQRCACAAEVNTIPPDLIIQDELHLISGPLGSMVGAFESALRYICLKDGVEPKYITSTATIRGAEKQLSDLYNRNAFQFPPSGLDADSNFFSRAVEENDKAKIRQYVGINAQGRSPKLVMARLYGLLNHLYKDMQTDPGTDQSELDGFRTVIGYFNARKELGGVKTMLGDDVPKWRKFHHTLDVSTYNEKDQIDRTELMAAVDSRVLMNELERTAKTNHTAPEFVLATNILSVGIDINRLVLMVIAGQPKTSSEYIQASSRVGRTGPGLVIVPFNWSRARDRSHYEKFRSYHEQLYRFVEGISVTPFSPEARRRTFAGTFVTAARHTIPGLREDEKAADFDKHYTQLEDFKEYYLNCISDPEERNDARNEVDKFLREWRSSAENKGSDFKYKATDTTRGVLAALGQNMENVNSIGIFVTSLRNVDEEVPAEQRKRPYGT